MKLFLKGRIDGMNTIINANRANRYAGAQKKKELTEALAWQIRSELPAGEKLIGPHSYTFTWYEPNRRRDPDNISSAVKFIFDGLQQAGIIDNDGWKQVHSLHHEFICNGPVGVEVEIEEVK